MPTTQEILTAAKIRANCEEQIENLQRVCKHPKKVWTEECWAPAHFTGRSLLVCVVCEKVLRTKSPNFKKLLKGIKVIKNDR